MATLQGMLRAAKLASLKERNFTSGVFRQHNKEVTAMSKESMKQYLEKKLEEYGKMLMRADLA